MLLWLTLVFLCALGVAFLFAGAYCLLEAFWEQDHGYWFPAYAGAFCAGFNMFICAFIIYRAWPQ